VIKRQGGVKGSMLHSPVTKKEIINWLEKGGNQKAIMSEFYIWSLVKPIWYEKTLAPIKTAFSAENSKSINLDKF
jgi:hypothetical protein